MQLSQKIVKLRDMMAGQNKTSMQTLNEMGKSLNSDIKELKALVKKIEEEGVKAKDVPAKRVRNLSSS